MKHPVRSRIPVKQQLILKNRKFSEERKIMTIEQKSSNIYDIEKITEINAKKW